MSKQIIIDMETANPKTVAEEQFFERMRRISRSLERISGLKKELGEISRKQIERTDD